MFFVRCVSQKGGSAPTFATHAMLWGQFYLKLETYLCLLEACMGSLEVFMYVQCGTERVNVVRYLSPCMEWNAAKCVSAVPVYSYGGP